MENKSLLVIEGLKKYFPTGRGLFIRAKGYVKAVDGVDIVVNKGETIGLVGESGCGKTTLANCILRLDEPTDGKIILDGHDILAESRNSMKQLRRDIQIIFQDPYSSLNPRKTVSQTIGEAFIIHGLMTRSQRQERIAELMTSVGLLPESVDRYPHEFSGGQRQRICIARALALNPKLVIADEPVSALDVSIQAQILNLLVSLQKKFNLTYIFISHDLSVVRHISDRIAIMYLGRLVEVAPTKEFFNDPCHPYTESLLSAIPVPNPIKRRKRFIIPGDMPSSINPPSGCSFHPRCSFSQQICIQQAPKLEEIETNHFVACHYSKERKVK